MKDRWCAIVSPQSPLALQPQGLFCSPQESLQPPGLSHMVLNERQSEEGGKDAEWETLAPCKGASQAATTDKRKVSFSRVDCWRNLTMSSRCLLRASCAIFYICSAFLQAFIRGFIKISTTALWRCTFITSHYVQHSFIKHRYDCFSQSCS